MVARFGDLEFSDFWALVRRPQNDSRLDLNERLPSKKVWKGLLIPRPLWIFCWNMFSSVNHFVLKLQVSSLKNQRFLTFVTKRHNLWKELLQVTKAKTEIQQKVHSIFQSCIKSLCFKNSFLFYFNASSFVKKVAIVIWRCSFILDEIFFNYQFSVIE